MSTSRSDIEKWVRRAHAKGCTHLMVVCDDFDHEDYPVEINEGEDIHKKMEGYNFKNMQRIMEVYSMKMPLDLQLAERRAWHPDHK
mgnify:CR=1 FL=1